MADRNRTSVYVQNFVRNAKPVAAVDHLNGKRLIQLPQPDIIHRNTGALQKFRNSKHRADAHFIGLGTGYRDAAIDAKRFETALLRQPAIHDDRG